MRGNPSTSSMMIHPMPSSSPESCTFAMFGWEMLIELRASRRRRDKDSSSPLSSGRSTFAATMWPLTRSRAFQTSPMPPWAMGVSRV